MRDIKFRLWDKECRIMNANPNDTISLDGRIMLHRGLEKPENTCYVIMQYTGLLDKNGVEIYEGDIVRTSTGYNYEIEWGGAFVDIKGLGHDEDWTEIPCSWSFDGKPADCYFCEVIGNIYENPELLEKKQ